MTAEVTLQRYDAEQARPLLERLVAVYLEVYGEPADGFHGESRFRRQITGHMTVPGWRLVAAKKDDELIGYAYGFPLAPSTLWWRGLRTPVPEGFANEDGARTFAISEIMVRQRWRRQGVARALHDELLAGRSEERATLLAEPGNATAQAAYATWGWQKVAQLRPGWENAPLFDVLIKPLY